MTRFVQSYPEEAMILLDVMALATDVGIFCGGIRQNSCASNELQDFWQSPLRFDSTIQHAAHEHGTQHLLHFLEHFDPKQFEPRL